MEPRWKVKASSNKKFLGGTADFDLWSESELHGSYTVFIVNGDGNDQWDWFSPPHNKERFDSGKTVKTNYGDVKPTIEQWGQVLTYLQLFAPWVFEGGDYEEEVSD